MPESENRVAAATEPESPGGRSVREEKKFPRGLVIRLFAYLVAGHVFAAFLYVLFELGAKG
ncbi:MULTISPECIES: DUF6126 family protein [unclassified Streptomyces]|uniref:DUF6126 family protein n=1 Tax=unclassified Streptomyces TaxID=2593676 RepID=UPI003812DC90